MTPRTHLMFDKASVLAILALSEAAQERRPNIEQLFAGEYRVDGKDFDMNGNGFPSSDDIDGTKIPAGIWLVGDQGVYVMSNHKASEGEGLPKVEYAVGINPDVDEQWYDLKRAMFGGDDGCEFIDAATVRKALSSEGATHLAVKLTSKSITIGCGQLSS